MGVGLLMFVGYLVFCETFIRLWMFNPVSFPLTSVQAAAHVMAILAASKLLLLFSFGCSTMLAAMGHIGFAAKVTVCESLANLLLSIAFVVIFDFGLAGVALGTLVARILTSTAVIPWYTCQKTGMDFLRYLVEIGGRGVAAGLIFATACYGLQYSLQVDGWPEFFMQVGAAVAIYIPIALLILVPIDDRRLIFAKLRGLSHAA